MKPSITGLTAGVTQEHANLKDVTRHQAVAPTRRQAEGDTYATYGWHRWRLLSVLELATNRINARIFLLPEFAHPLLNFFTKHWIFLVITTPQARL